MIADLLHSMMLQLAIFDSMHICNMDTIGFILHQEYPESLMSLCVVLPMSVSKACNLDPNVTQRSFSPAGTHCYDVLGVRSVPSDPGGRCLRNQSYGNGFFPAGAEYIVLALLKY